jgi:hypothetical protein
MTRAAEDAQLVAARRRLYVAAIELVCFGEGSRADLERLRRQVLRLKRRRGKKRRKSSMAWKKLVMPLKPSQIPAISLNLSGRLCYTQALAERIGEPPTVEIYIDEERKLLGIRPGESDGDKGLLMGKNNAVTIKKLLTVTGLWERLSLPITLRPATVEDDGIWAIPIELAEEQARDGPKT